MNKQICITLTALMLASTFAGCGQANATETAFTPPENTILEPIEIPYSAPDRFTGDWTGLDDTFHVHADASTELPELNKLCTAFLERQYFTQEQADKMLEVLLKGNTLYKEVTSTKQSLQATIDEYEAMVRGEIPYPKDRDGSVERLPEVIAYYKEMLPNAPNTWEIPLADTKFHPHEALHPSAALDLMEISGHAEVDGETVHIRIWNGEYLYPEADFWRDGYSNSDRIMFITPSRSEYPAIQDDIHPAISMTAAVQSGNAIIGNDD